MSKRDALIALYAGEIEEKFGETADLDLLRKVTVACGPSIYRDDARLVAGSERSELERIKTNFLVRKLGLSDGPALGEGIAAVMERYGKSNRSKHRAVVYYMLAKHFGREAACA